MSNKKVPVEVYSRVVGYFRPVNQWNKGKQEEFNLRKEFSIKSIEEKVCVCER
jgi:anaerobic ribonucleoside-triphosphate reductase